MFEFLVIAALVVLALACRTFESRVVSKIGLLSIFAATYLMGYWIADSHIAGVAALSLWVLLPWVEIVGRVRKMRIPLQSVVKHRFPPNEEEFPELGLLTDEIEELGFQQKDDTGWEWDGTKNYVRLFYDAKSRKQAGIHLSTQGEFSISFITITSRTRDGCSFTTSNYPFSFTMKFAPQQRVNRYIGADSFEDLLASHEEYLQKQSVTADDLRDLDEDSLHTYVEGEISHQVAHNLSVGVLEATDDGKTTRYTWRGCFYLWVQVVKDMLLA
jgi:hypothetical protein